MSQTLPPAYNPATPNGKPRDMNEQDYYAAEAAKIAGMQSAALAKVGDGKTYNGDGSLYTPQAPPPPPSTPGPLSPGGPAVATPAGGGGGGAGQGGSVGGVSPPIAGLQAAVPTMASEEPMAAGLQGPGATGRRQGMGMRTPPALQMLISGSKVY